MNIKTNKVKVVLEIDQSEYLKDEDYDGLDTYDLLRRDFLARLLDKDCYYPVEIKLELENEG